MHLPWKMRLLYGFLVLLLAHYVFIVPSAMMGFHISNLLPGRNLWSVSGHVLVMCAVWFFSHGNKVAQTVTLIIVLIFGLLVNQFLSGWPAPGMPNLAQNWLMTVLQFFVSPAVAYLMLRNDDLIAPRIIKNWGSA